MTALFENLIQLKLLVAMLLGIVDKDFQNINLTGGITMPTVPLNPYLHRLILFLILLVTPLHANQNTQDIHESLITLVNRITLVSQNTQDIHVIHVNPITHANLTTHANRGILEDQEDLDLVDQGLANR